MALNYHFNLNYSGFLGLSKSYSNNQSDSFCIRNKPVNGGLCYFSCAPSNTNQISKYSFNLKPLSLHPKFFLKSSAANVGPLFDNGGSDGNDGGNKGTGGEGNDNSGGDFNENNSTKDNWIFGAFSKGWDDRVKADPQFVFKVFTEQIIGVSACVIGDMASRPNFGINELDFVFSTMVVGSLVNFLLMYMLAPVSAVSSAATLPGIFANCPTGHMFEAGAYTAMQRTGTFVYKGLQFATAGFIAGLFGTAISNVLLEVRKKIQPDFELQNTPPPTLLNAFTWALHLGVSSNLRYQALNGLDGILSKKLSPAVFKTFVFSIRGGNNVIGGSTFAMLAKYTGAQKASSPMEKEKSLAR